MSADTPGVRRHLAELLDKQQCEKCGEGLETSLACINVDSPPVTEGFDLGIMSANVWPEGCAKVLQVVHGVTEHERPNPRADGWVYVSEEAALHWGMGVKATVIAQPVERLLGMCAPLSGPIVRWSPYSGLPWLPGVVNKAGYSFLHLRGNDPHCKETHTALHNAKAIISSGRGALEAAAYGKPVLLLDHRPYRGGTLHAGWLCQSTYDAQKKVSFSCVGGTKPPATSIARQLADIPQPFELPEEHDPKRVASTLLEIARTL